MTPGTLLVVVLIDNLLLLIVTGAHMIVVKQLPTLKADLDAAFDTIECALFCDFDRAWRLESRATRKRTVYGRLSSHLVPSRFVLLDQIS